MSKRGLLLLTLMVIISLGGIAFAANPVKLVVNGREIKPDVPPQLIKGRMMVPARWLGEALGANVGWDGLNRTVTVNQAPDIWSGEVGLTGGEWISIRNQITRFLMAFDERDEAGKQLVSSDFDTNLLGPEVVIPIGGLYPAIVDYEFVDAKKEANGLIRVRVKIYEQYGNAPLTCQNWDFLIDNTVWPAYRIKGLYVDEKQPLDAHTVFPGLTMHNDQ